MKWSDGNFNFYSPINLTVSMQTKIAKLWRGYDLYPQRGGNEVLNKENNEAILQEIASLGVSKITQNSVNTETLLFDISTLDSSFNENYENLVISKEAKDHIVDYLNKYPLSGIWVKIDETKPIDSAIVEIDWLPNQILGTASQMDKVFTNVIRYQDIVYVTQHVLINNKPIINKIFNLANWEYFRKNDLFLPKDKMINLLYNMKYIDDIYFSWRKLYMGRRKMVKLPFQTFEFGNFLIFLYNMSERLTQLQEYLSNSILLETYDPRVLGINVSSESYNNDPTLLEQDINDDLQCNEFFDSFKRFEGYQLTHDNRLQLLQRYGNTIYTFINDYQGIK